MSQNFLFFFFFQAEDGIRDATVTGVQTCALPISPPLADVTSSRRRGLQPIWCKWRASRTEWRCQPGKAKDSSIGSFGREAGFVEGSGGADAAAAAWAGSGQAGVLLRAPIPRTPRGSNPSWIRYLATVRRATL